MIVKEVISIFDLDFYQMENGKIPVQDFLYSLEPKLRAKAFREIERARKYMEDYIRRVSHE